MFLENLEIVNFRNIELANLKLKERTNVFFGFNGQGKTNLLEALYILFNKRSFRKTEIDIVNSKSSLCFIKGIIDIEGVKNTVSFEIEGNRKIHFFNNKVIKKRLSYETFLLSSDILFYFKNFPFFRRRLIDKMCYFLYGNDFLSVYKMLIKSKKSLQKATETKDKYILSNILIKYKKSVDNYRLKFFEEIKENFDEIKKKMLIPDITIKIFRDERDDIIFSKGDKRYLSVGELKSVIFSIYISVLNKGKDGNKILLIDDFNSEWDNNNVECAFDILSNLRLQSFIMMNQNLLKADFEIRKGEILSL